MDFESQQQEYLQQQGYRYYQHQQLVKQQYQSQAPTRPTEEIPGPSYPLSSSYSTFSNHISSYNSSQTTTQSPLRCCTFGIGEGPIRNSIFLCNLPIFGQTPLHIHYFWPFLILILAISVASTSISFLYFFYAFLMSCPILFGTVLIHELGHASMAVYYGGEVRLILLWPLGGVAYLSLFGRSNPAADAMIAIAGPLTHVPQVLFWSFLLSVSGGKFEFISTAPLTWSTLWLHICHDALLLQFVIFLFNLLPAFPLDGGRILAAFLMMGRIEDLKVYRICSILGGAIGSALFIQSLTNVLSNQSILFLGWSSLLIGIFLVVHSWNLWKSAETNQKPMEYPI